MQKIKISCVLFKKYWRWSWTNNIKENKHRQCPTYHRRITEFILNNLIEIVVWHEKNLSKINIYLVVSFLFNLCAVQQHFIMVTNRGKANFTTMWSLISTELIPLFFVTWMTISQERVLNTTIFLASTVGYVEPQTRNTQDYIKNQQKKAKRTLKCERRLY